MPVMNGRQAVERLRQLHIMNRINLNNTKIYMHSAIQGIQQWQDIFDGRCKEDNINAYSEQTCKCERVETTAAIA